MKGLWIIRQAGTASAFIKALEEGSCGDAQVWAYPSAEVFLRGSRVPYRPIEERTSTTEVLKMAGAKFLVTGTSLKREEDALWWQAARAFGIPSFAYVDQWANLARRFDFQRAGTWPDYVLCLNQYVRERLLELWPGKNPDSIIASGNPYHAHVREEIAPLVAQSRDGLLHSSEAVRILFATEPAPTPLPHADLDALDSLVSILRSSAWDFTLTIRVHPNDDKARALVWAQGYPDIPIEIVDADVDPVTLWARAHLVTGLSSIFLIESALAGVASLSLCAPEEVPFLTENGVMAGELAHILENLRGKGDWTPLTQGTPVPGPSHFINLIHDRATA